MVVEKQENAAEAQDDTRVLGRCRAEEMIQQI